MRVFTRIIVIAIAIGLYGCPHHQKIPPEEVHTVYIGEGMEDTLLSSHAPAFLSYDYRSSYNRIGRPAARLDDKGRQYIYVDTERPAIYFAERQFSAERGTYTNLIYRVHFPKVPFSLVPFYITSGRNVGVMVIITLDSEQRPVLVSTVGTCGCYLTIVPTTYLSRDAWPENMEEKPLEKYGEVLPPVLDYSKKDHPRLLVHLRPGVHRVMDLEIIDGQELLDSKGFRMIQAHFLPVSDLERISLNGDTTSFYYQDGRQKGHVRGSVKLWETLLMSLISMDFYVGTDKVYEDDGEYGNPFYTSLKPWNRGASDMRDFPRFLEFWGWGL
jgi:hypothetical protein